MEAREGGVGLNASFLLDGEDRILEGNRDAEVFLEKPLEEVRKVPLQKANPALYGALKELLAKTRRGRGVEDYAMAYKVGKRLLRLEIDMSPYPLEALGETGILVSMRSAGLRPMPARRAAEEPPPGEEAEAHEPADLKGFLDSLVEPAFILDLDANFSYVNPAMSRALGREREDLEGRPLSFFLRSEEAKRSLGRLVEAVHKAPWRGELEFSRRDGGAACIAVTVSEIKGKGGRKKALLCLGRENTTECRLRREREEELRRVWSMLERVGVAVASFTPDLRVTMLSRSAEELLGTSSDRAVGAPLPEVLPPGMAERIAPLLERAVRGEELEDERVEAGVAGEKGFFYFSVRSAYAANGVTREYLAVFRTPGREVSQAEEAATLREAASRAAAILETAVASRDEEDFLRGCLERLRDEFACEAAAAFAVERGQALLRGSLGLEEGEAEALEALRLRPGHARRCAVIDVLKVEIHGGIPRRGWDEVHSLIEKADTLLPLLRERRWKNMVIIPLRVEGGTAGSLVLADCEADRLDLAGTLALAAVGDAAASALAALRRRPPAVEECGGARGGVEDDGGGERRSEGPPQRGIMPVITRKAREGGGAALEVADVEAAGGYLSARGADPAACVRAGHQEHDHDYFEIAREAKGKEDADNLVLFAEHAGERAVPSARGIDLGELLWELKEYYARRLPRGEIFLELEEDLPRLHCDRRMLRESLDHLLDNAFRHSPPGAPVVLGAERWGDEVLLRVEDQGPGIPAEVAEEVMSGEPGRGTGNGKECMGGLYLCRRYVSSMGGTLSIKGRPGEGTTVFMRLRVLPFVGEGT
ncbi:MAG: PAS domain-containing protein [Actinomycetota bacterium]|nr:PAS domain-containing protein [Actinomycetota bacterium]